MFQRLNHRLGHHLLLLTISGLLFFPSLGKSRLWDVDEGNNVECGREMYESGDWIVPTFNYGLRTDKPALLYWAQMAAFRVAGVTELAGRLPSALSAVAAVLLTYEFGRRLFGAAAGLLASLILASTALFCAAAHFANPDALLNFLTVATFFIFWLGFDGTSRLWFVSAAVTSALAVLAKGPIGIVLPMAATFLFICKQRRWHLLLDHRLLYGGLAFAAVALPWYLWVSAETKGEFLRGFFLQHNFGRFISTMNHHNGPIYYYLLALLVGFAPWSAFLGFAFLARFFSRTTYQVDLQSAGDGPRTTAHGPRTKLQFLHCWIAVYVVFFSFSSTKLPNYILPIYPPLAMLIAYHLDRWRRGELKLPPWAIHVSLACLVLMGVALAVGFLAVGGVIGLPVRKARPLPALSGWALLGIVPILGAIGAWVCWRLRRPTAVLASLATAAILLAVSVATWAGTILDPYKAPWHLARLVAEHQTEREIRLATYAYFQPSLVYYCRREVVQFGTDEQVLEFLRYPVPVYLFVPERVWKRVSRRVAGPNRLLGRHYDLYRGCDILVVTNSSP